jgi:hypothetical protein
MMATTQRRTVMVSLCAVALLAVSGCGGWRDDIVPCGDGG